MNCYRYYWMLYILIAVLPSFSFAKKTDAQQVREMIEQVNDAWQKNHAPEARSFWDYAAYHTGNMEAYFLTGKEEYRKYSEAWAEYNQWMGAKSNNKSEWKYK